MAAHWQTVFSIALLAFGAANGSAEDYITFGGAQWIIREAPPTEPPVPPGNNYFAVTEDSVYVDELGRLHLAIVRHAGAWHSSEISSLLPASPGRYRFRVLLPNDPPLDPNVAVAIFLYADEDHEFDIEISEFLSRFDCDSSPCASCTETCQNCQIQFVRQPFCDAGNWRRFAWPGLIADTVHEIEWSADGKVQLSSAMAGVGSPPLLSEVFSMDDSTAPPSHPPYRVHLSFWLKDQRPAGLSNSPRYGLQQKVIIESLELPAELIREKLPKGRAR